MTLRPYQQQLKNDIYESWNAGYKNTLAVLPTGGGKTNIFADINGEHKGLSVAIAHRVELVNQISLRLAEFGIRHNIIGQKNLVLSCIRDQREEFGKSFFAPNAPCSVASVNTLNSASRQHYLKDWFSQVTLWTIDEAHHVLQENVWGKAIAKFPNARGLGVTATPKRADKKGLGIHNDGVFYNLVQGPSMRDLINSKWLSDFQIVIPESDFDVSNLAITKSGDYSPNQLRQAAEKSHIVGDVVESYLRFANGMQGICFATDVKTAKDMADRYNYYGISAAAVDANTQSYERAKTIKEFRNRQIKVLVNVDLFGEGFDVPGVEVVQMARPTKSLGLYLQQFGRALRLMEGKLFALVIDHVSNVKEHGLPDKPRYWSLEAEKETRPKDPEDIPLTSCKACFRPYERFYRTCPHCGHDPYANSIEQIRSIEQVEGDLMLLDTITLQKMREATILEAPAGVGERVAAVAGKFAGLGAVNKQIERIQAQNELKEAIAYWAGLQRALGRPDEQSYRRFYHWLGVDVLGALALPKKDMMTLVERIKEKC